MSKARVATMSGDFLAPGVSLNNRRYSAAVVGKAVERMRSHLADGTKPPLTMLTHHDAGDDSREIVGRLTSVELAPDGKARFKADIADTAAGRDIAALTAGDSPYLANVSIRGAWLGEVRNRGSSDPGKPEEADDLEIDGIDFTKSPGVTGARIQSVATEVLAKAAETTSQRVPIFETAAATVHHDKEAPVPTTKDKTTTETTPEPVTAPENATTEARPLTTSDIPALVEAFKSAAVLPVVPTTETTPPTTEAAPQKSVAETVAEKVAELKAVLTTEVVNAVRKDVLDAYGPPKRRGVVPNIGESGEPAKPLHQMTPEEWREHQRQTWDQVIHPETTANAAS